MNKKYLMKGMAALALIASVSSCVSDVDGLSQADIDAKAKENAELMLGITIPDGQTWNMSTQVTTNVVINLGLDQNYTVGIYDVDPRFSKNVKYYALEKVSEGGVLNASVTLPNTMSTAYIAVYDSKLNLRTVSVASVENGKIEANVGGTTGNRAMRGVFTDDWSKRHECKIDESKFDMTVPSNAVDITKGNYTEAEKSATVFYIPSDFNGDVSFYAFNIPAGAKVYNLGTVTGFNANHNGVTVFYNVGTMTYTISSGSRHTVINTGVLTVKSFANIGDVYNGGTLVLDNWGYAADIPNDMHIYSNGAGGVILPHGGDFKAVCDIHGTITVPEGNLKIQNSTWKYVCGIDVQKGDFENVDGPLETSYVHANTISFDGNPIYLLPQGYIKAENTIKIPNSGCQVYAYKESYALVEATNFEFGNKNDFTHTFTNSIKFKVSGYVKVDNCYAMGQGHYFNNVNEYLTDTTHSDEFSLAKDRINLDNVYGTSECGGNYGNIPTDPEPGIKGEPAIYTFAFEDQRKSGDYDMNDVVVKVSPSVNADGTINFDKLDFKLVAAGATFNIWVKIGEETLFGGEVHDAFEVSRGVMVNTAGTVQSAKATKDPVSHPTLFDTPAAVKVIENGKTVGIDLTKLDIWIDVNPGSANTADQIKYLAETTEPSAVLIPNDWAWPIERTRVTEAYPNFAAWAATLDRTDAMNAWYNTPASGKTMKNTTTTGK